MLAKKKPKRIMFETALKQMRNHGARLMIMSDPSSETGRSYFVVPGGMIEDKEAEKLIARPDVHACKDGLFPGHTQTWRLGSL